MLSICNHSRFIKLLAHVSLLLSIVCCQTGEQPSTRRDLTGSSSSYSIFGTWLLTGDDEYPGGDIPHETISFHKDSRLRIDGASTFCGTYSVSDDQIHMAVPINGLEIVYVRKFKIDKNGLHLENPGAGAAHYARVMGKDEYCAIYESWKILRMGYFSVKAPGQWKAKNKLLRRSGIQELQLFNRNASKIMILIRLPSIHIERPDMILKQSLNKVVDKVMAHAGVTRSKLQWTELKSLYGINGLSYVSESSRPVKATFKGVIRKLYQSYVLVITFHLYDRLHELEYIAQSIYADGLPMSSEHPVY
jgi:hypothetical protein